MFPVVLGLGLVLRVMPNVRVSGQAARAVTSGNGHCSFEEEKFRLRCSRNKGPIPQTSGCGTGDS